MVNNDEIRETAAREIKGLLSLSDGEVENLRKQTLFNDYVQANIKRAEVMEKRKEQQADLNESEKHLNEMIRSAKIDQAEKVAVIVDCIKKIREMKKEKETG